MWVWPETCGMHWLGAKHAGEGACAITIMSTQCETHKRSTSGWSLSWVDLQQPIIVFADATLFLEQGSRHPNADVITQWNVCLQGA